MITNINNCSNSAADIVYICHTKEQPKLDPNIEQMVNKSNKAYDWNPTNCKYLL